MASHYNWIDYIFIAIFLISILTGLMRGGVREIISLITWVVAFIVGSLFARPLAAAFASSPSVQSVMSNASGGLQAATDQTSLFALGASFCVLFFGTILIGSFIGYIMNAAIERTGISIVNRFAGGIFGFGRGYLVNLVIIFLVQLTPMGEDPTWAKSSLVKDYQPAVNWLGDHVQPGLESLKSKMGETLDNLDTSGQSKNMGIFQDNQK